MKPADDRVLEFIMSNGPSSIKTIHESGDVDYAYNTIATRARVLADNGLLDKIGQGSYQLADKGQQYLVGAIDLRDEPEPE